MVRAFAQEMIWAQSSLQPEGIEMQRMGECLAAQLYPPAPREPGLCIRTRASTVTFPAKPCSCMGLPLQAAELHACGHTAAVRCSSPLHSANTLRMVNQHTGDSLYTQSFSQKDPKILSKCEEKIPLITMNF